MSHVFISSDLNYVYQYFKSSSSVKNIKNIFSTLNLYPNINIFFNNEDEYYSYNIFNYISNIHSPLNFNYSNVILWKKIICLNSFNNEQKKNIILNNIVKFLWDFYRISVKLFTVYI